MTNLKRIAVAAASLLIFTNITYAQSVKAGYTVNAEEPLKVKYLGEDNDYLFFQVTSKTDDPSKARFTIEDKNEGQMYASGLTNYLNITSVKIEKKFEDQVLNFKLALGKKTYVKSFTVNTNVVETTTVAARDITKL